MGGFCVGHMDKLIKCYLVSFGILVLIWVTLSPTGPIGESDDYMMAAIAFENHFSYEITANDLAQAKIEHPAHWWHIGALSYAQGKDGKLYPWYLGPYSLTVIPMKILLRVFNLDTSYAFVIMNALYLLAALYCVYRYLKVGLALRFLLIIALSINPIWPYLLWPSSEVFMYSMMTMSLVFLINRQHFLAAFLSACAASMNIAASMLGLIIIIDFVWVMVQRKLIFAKDNVRRLVLLSLCFIPLYYVIAQSYLIFGVMLPHMTLRVLDETNPHYWILRVYAYLFDLNLEFILYYPVTLLLSLYMMIRGFIKHERRSCLFALGFLLTVIGYSQTPHIGCGMEGLARYNAWTAPIIILYVIIYFKRGFRSKFGRIAASVTLVLAVISTGFMSQYPKTYSWLELSPFSKYVLNRWPQYYYIYPEIFGTRVLHDNGSVYTASGRLAIYTDSQYNIRKLQVATKLPNAVDIILNAISGSPDDEEYVRQTANYYINKGSRYIFINFPSPQTVKPRKEWPIALDTKSGSVDEQFTQGLYHNEGTHQWVSRDATVALSSSLISEIGLEIGYFTIPELLKPSNGSPLLEIYVDGTMVEVVNLLEAKGQERVIIPPEKLNVQDHRDCTIIRLVSNVSFNPKRQNLSEDDRDISIALTYLGPTQDSSR